MAIGPPVQTTVTNSSELLLPKSQVHVEAGTLIEDDPAYRTARIRTADTGSGNGIES